MPLYKVTKVVKEIINYTYSANVFLENTDDIEALANELDPGFEWDEDSNEVQDSEVLTVTAIEL